MLFRSTVQGMFNWLNKHGFSYKKPALAPGKANPVSQALWIAEYEQLKNSLKENEAICFIDGVHPTHNTKPAYGWIKKGHRKEVRTNTGRQRLNISGAVDIHSKAVIIHNDETLNAASTIAFLQKIEANYPLASRVHLFCDNARYYRNKEVAKFLESSKIELHFLPPYSPNLNPIERLWKLLYENVLHNRYYEKFEGFKNAVFGFFQACSVFSSTLWEKVNSRISDNFHRLSLTENGTYVF